MQLKERHHVCQYPSPPPRPTLQLKELQGKIPGRGHDYPWPWQQPGVMATAGADGHRHPWKHIFCAFFIGLTSIYDELFESFKGGTFLDIWGAKF